MSEDKLIKGYILEAILTVKDEIDRHPFLKRKITNLLEQAGIGRNSFQNKFKLVTGKTVRRYRLEKRMEQAKELLAENKLTVRQVALRCGYKRQDQFCIDFKKVFGEPPSEFQHGNNNHSGRANGIIVQLTKQKVQKTK